MSEGEVGSGVVRLSCFCRSPSCSHWLGVDGRGCEAARREKGEVEWMGRGVWVIGSARFNDVYGIWWSSEEAFSPSPPSDMYEFGCWKPESLNAQGRVTGIGGSLVGGGG